MKLTKSINKKQYITISSVIYNNKDISATDKIVLAWFSGFDKENNTLTTATIAETLGLSVSAIRASIKRLVFLDLLEETYYFARKRTFKSLVDKSVNDAPVIIPNEILTSDVSSTYKISMGIIVASSLGDNNRLNGYNFNKVDKLIELLGLSKSSVYRHLALLQELGYITRDNSSTWLLRPHTEYTDKRFKLNNKKTKAQVISESSEALNNAPPLSKETDQLLNRIYDMI